MSFTTRRLLTALVPLALLASACGSSSDDAVTDTTSSATTSSATTSSATTSSATTGETSSDDTTEVSSTADASADADADADLASLFDDGALTADAVIVDCTLENGSETSCYQLEVSSLAGTVDTDGPYCPETVDDDEYGLWVWDGDDPGLYALDADFWTMMAEQGFDFVDADGNISITDPGAGAATSAGTANSCLEATADGSFHFQVLLPTTPELLDTPTDLSTISQIGLALDGVTIFGDAPSVADRGGLPALDACGGHIDPSGYYHWHFGAESIQSNLDEAGADVTCEVEQDVEALIAFAFDGYAIYGPEEDREIPSDLDECSGHVSDTDEFGEIYHYHLTYDSPNLPSCRVGASAVGTLSSPDNANVALPNGDGPGAGGPPAGDG